MISLISMYFQCQIKQVFKVEFIVNGSKVPDVPLTLPFNKQSVLIKNRPNKYGQNLNKVKLIKTYMLLLSPVDVLWKYVTTSIQRRIDIKGAIV